MPSNPANKIFYIAICALVGDERQMQKEGAEGRNTHRIGGGCNLLRIHTHIRNFQIKYNFYILIYIYIFTPNCKGLEQHDFLDTTNTNQEVTGKTVIEYFFFFYFSKKNEYIIIIIIIMQNSL